MTDSFTILRCAPSHRLAKTICPDGTQDFGSARKFDGYTAPVRNLDDVESLLTRLIKNPRLCVVRAALVDAPRATGIRRLVHPDPETGDEPTLRDVPRRWLAIDAEGIEPPPGLDLTDLPACARAALQRLPAPFRGADCIVQATAGHGLKPDLRLRLWFWLSRPMNGGELKRWLKGAPADPSVFGPAQVIFTAAPVFENCTDHLPNRMVRLPGAATVQVPTEDELSPPQPVKDPKPPPEPNSVAGTRYGKKALENAAEKVRTAPVNSRHPTCLMQARSLARLVEAGHLAATDVQARLVAALEEAGKSRAEGEKIVAWAFAHPSTSTLPEGLR